jgi:hypothetical protein
MILSKGNFQVLNITREDKGTPALNVIYLDPDGTTTSLSRSALVTVSPVTKETKAKTKHLTETPLNEMIILSGDTAAEIIKNIPKDTMFKGTLEHIDVSGEGVATIHDGKQVKTIKGKVMNVKPMPYKEILKNSLNKKSPVRSVVNLARLKLLLETMERFCNEATGEIPVYVEFADDFSIILRAENPRYGQRIISVMTSYKGSEGNWLQESEWENKLKAGQVIESKPKLKLKLKFIRGGKK